MALTPLAVLMNRFNIPDARLCWLLSPGAQAFFTDYTTARARRNGRPAADLKARRHSATGCAVTEM